MGMMTFLIDCWCCAYLPRRYNVIDLQQRLLWQHMALDKICGQMPAATREDLFGRLPTLELKTKLHTGQSEQQADSLSIDVTMPIHIHTGMEV